MSRDSRIDDLLSVWERSPVKPTPEELCARDPALLPDVREAIAGLQSMDRLMPRAGGAGAGRPTLEPGAATLDQPSDAAGQPPDDGVPSRIGSYRVTRVLGRGGMGAVYEAEQDRPRRTVALKVIAPGWVTPALLRRFEYEADVLARLDHPGVARVYEVGTAAPDGRGAPQPFFAMELVRGARLDEYVRRNNPSVEQRLRLFAQVCAAVHHAHTKGVIHRDLKPANILVTDDGHPKVLDFGIARATDLDLQVTTGMQTQSGQLVGTLPYMAPEQAAGRARELDTSSDVYALGVIAYELLSGRMPYRLDDRPLHEAVRAICEEEPSRLSSIDRTLRGDVETIVGKALAKEKSRRYPTAGELAADVKRFLDYEPISARPPSAWYQFSRFARRNRALVAGVAATFVVLVLGTAVSLRLAVREARQRVLADEKRQEAEAVVKFLTNDVLEGARPTRMADAAVRGAIVKVMIDPAAANVGRQFQNRPLVEAAVRVALAVTYESVGRADLGIPHARRAMEIRRTLLGADDPATLIAMGTTGVLLHSLGKLEEAEPLLREAADGHRRVLGDGHRDTLSAIGNLAGLLRLRGQHDDAIALQREVLERRRRSPDPDARAIGLAIHNLAVSLQAHGRLAEAEPLFREALRDSRAAFGDDNLSTLQHIGSLAQLLVAQGKLAEAEPLHREAAEGRRRVLGPDHPDTLLSAGNLAHLLQMRGRGAEALELQRDVLERSRRVLGDDHPGTLASLNNVAQMLAAAGRLSEAEPLHREALERRRRVLGGDHPETLVSANNLCQLMAAQGRLAEAEVLQREALEISRRTRGEDHPESLAYLANLASLVDRQGRFAEAEPLYREALERHTRALGPDHRQTLTVTSNAAAAMRNVGRHAEAERLDRDVLERRRRVLGEDHPSTLISRHNLAAALKARARFAEAEPMQREALTRARRTLGDGHPNTLAFLEGYGGVLSAMGRGAEAEAVLREVVNRRRRAAGEAHVSTVTAMQLHATALKAIGRLEEAERVARNALDVARANPQVGPEHKVTVAGARLLSDCLVQRDRPAEASALSRAYGFPDPTTRPVTPATAPTTAAAPALDDDLAEYVRSLVVELQRAQTTAPATTSAAAP